MLSKSCREAQSPLKSNMAGRSSVSSSSRAGSRRESFDISQAKSLASNVEFMQLLRRLPDELIRLDREIRKLRREANAPANASHSRVDSSSKRAETFWKSRLEIREKQLQSEQEEKISKLRNHYEQQLKNATEVLQKNNSELQQLLKESVDIASQRTQENETLKKQLREFEQQIQEQKNISSNSLNDTERYRYKQQMLKTRQALEEKRKELDSFKERHAAFSERRVRSDQRRTENTLSRNRQSQLESEYVTEFKDGARVDAIDIMTARVGRVRPGTRFMAPMDYLKCCRLACFIFEVAYETVANFKESFANFTSTVLETLAVEAPAIGSDAQTFQNKLSRRQYDGPKEAMSATRDALSEVMILVKEEAKSHDLSSLVHRVKSCIATKWNRQGHLQRDHLLLEYDSILLHRLNDYIKYCTLFAWCALTQVPPMKIDYSTTVYNSRSHMVSQAFSSSQERSPTRRPVYPEGQSILCYLWPVLEDCDGKVIRKGEVVLDSYR